MNQRPADRDPPERTALEVLDRAECISLVRTVPVGRVAVGRTGQAPLVVPFNFAVDVDEDEDTLDVVFRTDDTASFDELRQSPVSFQVDAFDPYRRVGWSVLLHGVLAEATADQRARITVEPWAPGPRTRWVRVRVAEVSGRRLSLVNTAEDERGYL